MTDQEKDDLISLLRERRDYETKRAEAFECRLRETENWLEAARADAKAWKEKFVAADQQVSLEYGAKLTVQKQVARLQDEVGRLNLAASAEKPLVKLDPEREALLTELQADAIRQDTERRAEEALLYKQFMLRQLKALEDDVAYRAFIREQTPRQTAAMEKIAYLLLERLPQ
jgi:hypothetical protein